MGMLMRRHRRHEEKPAEVHAVPAETKPETKEAPVKKPKKSE